MEHCDIVIMFIIVFVFCDYCRDVIMMLTDDFIDALTIRNAVLATSPLLVSVLVELLVQ